MFALFATPSDVGHLAKMLAATGAQKKQPRSPTRPAAMKGAKRRSKGPSPTKTDLGQALAKNGSGFAPKTKFGNPYTVKTNTAGTRFLKPRSMFEHFRTGTRFLKPRSMFEHFQSSGRSGRFNLEKMLARKKAATGAPSRQQPHRPKLGTWGLQGSLAKSAPTSPCPTMAKPPKQGQKSKVGPGSVFEASEAHKKRHQGAGCATVCLRCNYEANRGVFCQHAMKMPTTPGKAETWLEPRPEYKGGVWGLGCRICAWYYGQMPLMKKAMLKRRRHRKSATAGSQKAKERKGGRFSKFARFELRFMQKPKDIAEKLSRHGLSKAHEVACAAMLRKESQLETGGPNSSGWVLPPAPPVNPVAEKTFKGRVPKPKDWLDAFVETSNNVSFAKQARLAIGKSEIPSDLQGRPLAAPSDPQGQPEVAAGPVARSSLHNLRKRRRKQAKIMAECIRVRHRKRLREACFCTLALDEAQGRKLVRYCCDLKEPPWSCRGILGVFEVGPKTMGEAEEDHAVRAMTRLDEFITRFCTPLRKASLGPACDEELKDHLLKIVTCLSADGGPAERRALYLAAERMFLNLRILVRDSAHAIRIAMRDPLLHDKVFGQVWEELFNKKHAVVPDLQYSDKLRNLLVAAQREGAMPLGLPSGLQPLSVVTRKVMETFPFHFIDVKLFS